MSKGKLIDYSKYPESDLIVNYIYDRFRKGLYTHCPVSGLPGTGKSSTCQRLAELVYEKFDIGRKLTPDDIVDSLLDFLKRLKQVKEPGEIIIIEEISVLFPSRRAMANDNVAIGRVLDTCRKKQVILFSNAPIFSSIDSHIRAMSHILLETQKIVKNQGVVVSKAWRLQTNPHTGKTYRHRFTRNGRDVGLFYTKKPNLETWEAYEDKKDKFMDELYEELTSQQEKKKDKKDKEKSKTRLIKVRALTPREAQVKELCMDKGLNTIQAARELGISDQRVGQVLRQIAKKALILRE